MDVNSISVQASSFQKYKANPKLPIGLRSLTTAQSFSKVRGVDQL